MMIMSSLANAYGASGVAALKVIVDPGHGGSDRGAVRLSIEESKLSLHVAQLLIQELQENAPQFTGFLTRKADLALNLSHRAQLASQLRGDVFISIHANASGNDQIHGVEFYIQSQLPPDEEVLSLAKRENDIQVDGKLPLSYAWTPVRLPLPNEVLVILDDLVRRESLFHSSRLASLFKQMWFDKSETVRIRQAPFYLLENVTMPAVLIEMGYISHTRSAEKLSDPKYQKKIATSIFLALRKYKELVDIQPSADLH